MPRAIWSGSLSFGLVNIPVQLVSAVVDRGLHFHQLHDRDGARIKEQRICSKDGEVVPLEHIVKGYEISKGTSVPVTQEELEALAPEKTRAISLESFVPLEQINPVYFQHPYYLLPGEGAGAAYSLDVYKRQASRCPASPQRWPRGYCRPRQDCGAARRTPPRPGWEP